MKEQRLVVGKLNAYFILKWGAPGSSAIAASPVILSDGHVGSGENQCVLMRTFVTHPSQWLTGQNV